MAEEAQRSSWTTIETSPESSPRLPPWFAEAVLVAQSWVDRGLLAQLQRRVRVPRGRLGVYETCDFILLLLAYAVSGEPTLKDFFAALAVGAAALAAVWGRNCLPSPSALSRFLKALPRTALEALRDLLFEDWLNHGLPARYRGGLHDRQGGLNVLFDGDGTYQVARQRSLVTDEQHPPPRRRMEKLMAAGYAGRKRGEVVRTRMTVQQAHSGEWLGTFGHAGNGDTFGDLERVCQHLGAYLQSQGLPRDAGVLRLDGLYGCVRSAWIISQAGLGYLIRGSDYRLLKEPQVLARLEQPPDAIFTQPDTGTVRQVWDAGEVLWTAASDPTMKVATRVLVTRRPGSAGATKVGKRVGAWIYEVFVTDRSAAGWSVEDGLSFYFARGGFEQTLAQEDQEQDPDRWCSGHPEGQESWQLLCQWVWNLRLRLGIAAQPELGARRTLWAEPRPPAAPAPPASAPPEAAQVGAEPVSPGAPAEQDRDACAVCPPAPAPQVVQQAPRLRCAPDPAAAQTPPGAAATPVPQAAQTPPGAAATKGPPAAQTQGQVAAAAGRGAGRFGGGDFHWQPDGTLSCPAGKSLRPVSRRPAKDRERVMYKAHPSDCAACPLSSKCRGAGSGPGGAREVSVLRPRELERPPPVPSPLPVSPPTASPPPRLPLSPGPLPVYWDDLPATALRRTLGASLRGQKLEVTPPSRPAGTPVPSLLTRARRAHRRRSWAERLARNARPAQAPYKFQLFGIPPGVDAYLRSLRSSPIPA